MCLGARSRPEAAGSTMASEVKTTLPSYKRIIVCCDGTAATAYDYRDVGKKPFTNVSRISRSIRPQSHDGIPQVVLYLPGVGTAEGNIFNLWNRGYGTGLDEKIIEAYSFICHNYRSAEENNGIADEIFLMGYPRGAFTVRCVADMIHKAGLLRKEGICYVGNLYTLWRMEKQIPPPSSPTVRHANPSPSYFRGIDITFQQDPWLRHYPVRVKVCALWDTVNSTFRFRWGLPRRRFTFVDSECCGGIDNVIQALALHENRRPYRPIVLKRPDNSAATEKDASSRNNQVRLQQCWFAGKHSDIGRGKKGQDLDNFPLIWALDKLSDFLDLDLDVVWKTEPGRPTYGSKSSLDRNFFISWFADEMPGVVRQGLYRLMGRGNRKPGQQFWVRRQWQDNCAPDTDISNERLHESADLLFSIAGLRAPRSVRRHERGIPGVPIHFMSECECRILLQWHTKQLESMQDSAKLGDRNTGILFLAFPEILVRLQQTHQDDTSRGIRALERSNPR